MRPPLLATSRLAPCVDHGSRHINGALFSATGLQLRDDLQQGEIGENRHAPA